MPRFKRLQKFVFCIFLVFLTLPPAWPQASTASASGTVRDQTGGVMPGVAVSITNTLTNETFHTTTNGDGFYLFPGLVPAPYLLTVQANGMEKFQGTLIIQTERSAVVNVTMKVGQTTAQVAVQDVTPLVETDNPTIGDTLEHTRIEQLPINGRQVTTLLETVPGMEGTRSMGLEFSSFSFVLDGTEMSDRNGSTGGASAVYGSGFLINAVQPGLDSIQEFSVLDNSTSAKYARPTTIILSSKGGTNQLHGSAFETNRNNAVGLARSRTDYYTKAPYLNRNEFGVSAGGPVFIPKIYNGKNKTFWFFSYEALRQISNANVGFPDPSQAWRDGNLAGDNDGNGNNYTIYNPYSTDPNTWSRQPFPNNQIPVSMESPLAKYLLAVMPLPTLPNVNPNVAPDYFGPVPATQRQWTTSARIDQKFGDKDTFYGRYSQGNYSTLSMFLSQPTLNYKLVPSGTVANTAPNKSLATSWVHSFSPTLFNELLVSVQRETYFNGTGDNVTNYDAQLGLPNPFNSTGWPGLYSAGLAVGRGLEWETQNSNGAHMTYEILDDNATKVWGKHELQFGFHYRGDQLNLLPQQQQVAGNDDWATLATSLYDPSSSRTAPQALPFTGDNYANFYLGVMEFNNQYCRGEFYAREKEYAGYLQDKWKLTPRLTLNLGLRYEYWPPFSEKNGAVVSFDTANQAIVSAAPISKLEQLGYTFPSVVAAEQAFGVKFETPQQAGMPGSLETSNKLDFAPRLGFAYRLTKSAKPFVLRGGYALSYFHVSLGAWNANMRLSAPMEERFYYSMTNAAYAAPGTSQCTDGISNCGLRVVPTVIGGVNSSNVVTTNSVNLAPGSALIDYYGLNQPDPRVHNWNLTVEKEVMANTVVRLSYVGNHSYGMEQFYQFNLATPAYIWYVTKQQPLPTGTLASVATNAFNQTTYSSSSAEWLGTGWGNSNGIQAVIERRFSKGYAFQFFYTLDNNLAAGGAGYQGTSVIPAFNQFLPNSVPTNFGQFDRLYDYQRDTGVPKNRFAWNWVGDLPVGKGKALLANANPILNKIIGGWQISGIGSANSTYFTLPSGDFPSGTAVDTYGYKYPIQNCTSGTCYPGYLYYNGYIPSNLINSHNAAGQPNGYEGIPSSYVAAMNPLIVYGQTTANTEFPGTVAAPAGTNLASYYNGNTVWVPLANGTIQRTTWNGLAPLRQQYLPGIWQWDLDASLVKNIPFKERFNFRLQCDFFNVLNHPGNPNSIGSTGILSTQSSGNSPRTLQLTGRFTW